MVRFSVAGSAGEAESVSVVAAGATAARADPYKSESARDGGMARRARFSVVSNPFASATAARTAA